MNDFEKTPSQRPSQAAIEVLLIFLVFFLYAGWPPPGVNEAHYLAKAKHYWQPDWCSGDLFLESAKAHLFFYWTLGWLNLFLPLPAVAWLGRLVTWSALAWAWQRLSFALVPRPWIALLSASLFVFFNDRFHLAGEWVVGGVEAKGLAYVLVLLALEAMVRGRWRRVWILLGVATSLHVLVGGWAWVAAACGWLACGPQRPRLQSLLPAMALGLLLALPGVAVGLSLSWGVDRETLLDANYLYVYRRLPHHLVFHRFPYVNMARHMLLLGIWIVACCLNPCRTSTCQLGQRSLRGFVGGAVMLAVIGVVIDQSLLHHLDLAASLLKYYWFRSSDAFLPAGAALALVGLASRWQAERPRAAAWLLVGLAVSAGSHIAWSNYQRRLDLRPAAEVQMLPSWRDDPERTLQKYADWRTVCRWIDEHTPTDAVFITPRYQQTFKWHAQRAEVFAWKDVPQDPASIVEWWDRRRQLYPGSVLRDGLVRHGEERLVELAHHYGAGYIVVDRDFSRRGLRLPRVFPRTFDEAGSYEVYRVPPPSDRSE